MRLLLLLIFFQYSACIVNTATGDPFKTKDNTIEISLQEYNVSAPNGESIDTIRRLSPINETKILLTKIPFGTYFVVLQAHSYLESVKLSLDKVATKSNSISGTNVGLLKIFSGTDLSFYLTSSVDYEVDVMVSVQAYSSNAPIPGGCNMEFPVEVSPFLLINHDSMTTDVSFAPSSPPLSMFSDLLPTQTGECNVKPSPVRHEMYHRYFPERDFSRETYFKMLKSMMTKGRVLENGMLVREKVTGTPMKRIFATYPGTGNVFVVVSHFENFSSVYVPSFTYGCDDLIGDNKCNMLDSTFFKVLCAGVLFLGFFNCFFGHFFFRMEVFLFGYIASTILFYIFVSLLFSNSMALSTSMTLGLIPPLLKLFMWKIFGLPIVSTILTTLVFGFVFASAIYYPIIDYVDLFEMDQNFWGIFVGVVLACPILMTCLAEKANIISCAFVGSYVAISSVDYYVGSNLRYVLFNTMRRAVSDKFKWAVIDPPFQMIDAMLCFAWFIATLIGIILQKFLLRFKPPYPPPPSNSSSEISPLLPKYPSTMSGLF